jgi:hypothetical protein
VASQWHEVLRHVLPTRTRHACPSSCNCQLQVVNMAATQAECRSIAVVSLLADWLQRVLTSGEAHDRLSTGGPVCRVAPCRALCCDDCSRRCNASGCRPTLTRAVWPPTLRRQHNLAPARRGPRCSRILPDAVPGAAPTLTATAAGGRSGGTPGRTVARLGRQWPGLCTGKSAIFIGLL